MLDMVKGKLANRSLRLAGAVGVLVLLYVGFVHLGVGFAPQSPGKGSALGEPAPDFALADLNGRQLSLSQFRGRKVLLVFWASWCPPCRAEMPSLQRLNDNPAVEGLTILAVNAGETKERVAAFVARHRLTLPVLLDREGEVQRLYRAYQLPLAVVVDGQGRIAGRHLGLRDWNSAAAIAELNRLERK